MYAIIKENDGKLYGSKVFGIYRDVEHMDDDFYAEIKNCYYIVLDETKKKLIYKSPFAKGTNHIIKLIVVTDFDDSELEQTKNDSMIHKAINVDGIFDMIKTKNVPDEITKNCIEIDRKYKYTDTVRVKSKKDIDNLMCIAGEFHDGRIESIDFSEKDKVKILFRELWGIDLELIFEGDIGYQIKGLPDPKYYDPYWSCATLIYCNGYYYLFDYHGATIEDIEDDLTVYFKGERLTYRILPTPMTEYIIDKEDYIIGEKK